MSFGNPFEKEIKNLVSSEVLLDVFQLDLGKIRDQIQHPEDLGEKELWKKAIALCEKFLHMPDRQVDHSEMVEEITSMCNDLSSYTNRSLDEVPENPLGKLFFLLIRARSILDPNATKFDLATLPVDINRRSDTFGDKRWKPAHVPAITDIQDGNNSTTNNQ